MAVWVSELDTSRMAIFIDIFVDGDIVASEPVHPFVNLRRCIESKAIMKIRLSGCFLVEYQDVRATGNESYAWTLGSIWKTEDCMIELERLL